MRDIVFPKGNEESFLKMATKLGYKEIIFCYEFDGKNDFLEKVQEDFDKIKSDVKVEFCVKLSRGNIMKLKNPKVMTIFESDRENDRFVIEKCKPSMIFNFEDEKAKDYIHHRNSGLNQVLCKYMAENKIKYGLSLNSIIDADDNFRAQVIGRIKQNVKLCRKYKVDMKVFSFASDPYSMRSPADIVSLLCSFGMQQKEAKEALS